MGNMQQKMKRICKKSVSSDEREINSIASHYEGMRDDAGKRVGWMTFVTQINRKRFAVECVRYVPA